MPSSLNEFQHCSPRRASVLPQSRCLFFLRASVPPQVLRLSSRPFTVLPTMSEGLAMPSRVREFQHCPGTRLPFFPQSHFRSPLSCAFISPPPHALFPFLTIHQPYLATLSAPATGETCPLFPLCSPHHYQIQCRTINAGVFLPLNPLNSAFLPWCSFANRLLNLCRPTAPVPVKCRHEGQRVRVSVNQPSVSSKESYNLNAPPTNPDTVTASSSTDDSDLSSDEDAKPIKRTHFQNSVSLLKGFPGSQNWVSKTVAMMKVSNLAVIVNLLRELVCRQTKVSI